jgi:hypothetical protein
MHPIDKALAEDLGVVPSPDATVQIKASFNEAGVDCFACTHTCLPFAQDFVVEGLRKIVINNGSAGMPNFRDTSYGCITRFAVDAKSTEIDALYGTSLNGVRVDAVPLRFDTDAWKQQFVSTHPEASPAHMSYWDRINKGVPFFTIPQADRIQSTE